VLVAEWGDRFAEALGPEQLEVRLEEAADGSREITARARGREPELALARWRERCP
jgi:tRNA A37 threonylcarbamoyladenosine biosynthesis protein TsaE